MCYISLEKFHRILNSLKIKEYNNVCENGSPLTSKQRRMKFIKRAFVFFGLVWCVFMIISRILKKRKEDKLEKENKQIKKQ